MAGVLSGRVRRLLKSEPTPKKAKAGSSQVVKLVGNTVIDAVSQGDKDVLLSVYAPWCQHCRRLAPTLDILARAVAADDRIVIAKIDGTANDLPPHWGVKTYPALLWFPAKDKPYPEAKGPTPRPYWDAGQGLAEFVSFVQRHSSFDPATLKVATTEQLNSLLNDEDTLRQKYEVEESHRRRNEGRDIYDSDAIDWLVGEVVFDGKRWHIGAVGVLGVAVLVLSIAVAVLRSEGSKKLKKKKAL